MDIEDEGATLRVAGDLDGRSTDRLRQRLYERLGEHSLVVVDLSGVAGVDATALRVLAAATYRANVQGRRLVLRGCGPAVRRLLHLTRLIRAVEMDRPPRGGAGPAEGGPDTCPRRRPAV